MAFFDMPLDQLQRYLPAREEPADSPHRPPECQRQVAGRRDRVDEAVHGHVLPNGWSERVAGSLRLKTGREREREEDGGAFHGNIVHPRRYPRMSRTVTSLRLRLKHGPPDCVRSDEPIGADR